MTKIPEGFPINDHGARSELISVLTSNYHAYSYEEINDDLEDIFRLVGRSPFYSTVPVNATWLYNVLTLLRDREVVPPMPVLHAPITEPHERKIMIRK